MDRREGLAKKILNVIRNIFRIFCRVYRIVGNMRAVAASWYIRVEGRGHGVMCPVSVHATLQWLA